MSCPTLYFYLCDEHTFLLKRISGTSDIQCDGDFKIVNGRGEQEGDEDEELIEEEFERGLLRLCWSANGNRTQNRMG